MPRGAALQMRVWRAGKETGAEFGAEGENEGEGGREAPELSGADLRQE